MQANQQHTPNQLKVCAFAPYRLCRKIYHSLAPTKDHKYLNVVIIRDMINMFHIIQWLIACIMEI